MKKEKRMLNRKLPFGEVYGGGEASFEQHGILFDAEGIELPGFEDVEIPEEVPPVAEGDAGLQEQILDLRLANDRMAAEALSAMEAREDAMALAEELQGKLDTANIEIGRLNKLLSEAEAGGDKAEPETPPAAGKKKGADKTVDDQLALQTGGNS